MKIEKYLNSSEEEMRSKTLNIFYGFSLGNKYFTPDHIRSYLLWALENTKDKVAVLIPDKIQAVNYEVKSGYTPQRSLAVALRKGAEMEETVRKVIKELEISESKIQVLHWQDIEDYSYKKMHDAVVLAFQQDPNFRETVVQMVRETPHMQSLSLSENQYVRLAQYILDELPVLISGFTLDGVHYGVMPYPGFANLDYLALDLQEGTTFPELTRQLNPQEKLRLVELYAE